MLEEVKEIMQSRFGKDSLISIATIDETGKPWVRTVDALFIDDSFYVVTYQLSKKMKHLGQNDLCAICGEWFSGHAKGINLGYIMLDENKALMEKVREAFKAWYYEGHNDESDTNTILLQLKIVDGILLSNGKRYDI